MERSDQPPAIVDADAQIVDRIRRGDVQAYGTLVERYERAVLAAVLGIVRDVHDAEDVAQDVFVRCYTQLGSLRDSSRFGPWLLKIAGREAVHASRRTRRMRIERQSDANEFAAAARHDQRVLSDERELLLQCVRSLPAHERMAVSLRYFDGHGVNEISDIVGRPVGTITKQLSRAIERLRDQLNKGQRSWPTRMNDKSLVR